MLENKSVCLLNDSFPPLIDGVANAVVNYANILTNHGHPVVVATPRYPGSAEEYPFPVVRYRSLDTTKLVGYRAGYPFSMRAISRIQKENIGLIHSHCPVMSTVLARTLREIADVPIVFTYHTKFDIDLKHAIRNGWVEKAALRFLVKNISACDEVWVVSRGAGENLRQLGYEGETIAMPNGVDLPAARAPQQEVAALSRSLGLPEGAPVYLFVGRMKWYKGLRIILDALRILKEGQFPFRMIFVGDGDERGEVMDYARQIGVMDECLFPGPIRDREALRTYFTRANLFLFPSTYDTNGIVVREAAACGVASVLVAGSCAAEDVTDGQNGIFIQENAQSMAEVLRTLGTDFDAMANLGRHAQQEIYITWEDSVHRAWERYGVVLEQYQRNPQPHNSIFDREVELFFKGIAQLYTGVSRVQRATSALQAKTRSLGEQVSEKLEKHLPARKD